MTEWVYNGIKETGIGNIIMSGGVAQNIKANKIITELHNLNQLYIPPGPGDESISIGAAFVESTKHIKSIIILLYLKWIFWPNLYTKTS